MKLVDRCGLLSEFFGFVLRIGLSYHSVWCILSVQCTCSGEFIVWRRGEVKEGDEGAVKLEDW